MGVFDIIRRVFKKEEKAEGTPPETPALEEVTPKLPSTIEERPIERPLPPEPSPPAVEVNIRTKLDLISAQIDSLKMQNQMIIERLKNLEKMIAEMRGIRYY